MLLIDLILWLVLAASFGTLLYTMHRKYEPPYPDVPFVLGAGFVCLSVGGLVLRNFDSGLGYTCLLVGVLWLIIYAAPIIDKLKKIERGEKV